MRYFNYATGLAMTNGQLDRLFGGQPREPESQVTQREMDIARSIQAVTEEIILSQPLVERIGVARAAMPGVLHNEG